MKKQALWVAAVVSFMVAGNVREARADQCAVVTKKVAEFASSILRSGTGTWIEYCEPCGDKPPRKYSERAKKIEVRKYLSGYQLLINDKAVDLAYIYVSVGDYNKYSNLGLQAGCGATDVSPTYEMNWTNPAPAPKDPLAGTWVLTDETQLSTCTGDPVGNRTTDTWTIDVVGAKVTARTKGNIELSSDKGKVLQFEKAGAKSTLAYKLVVQDDKTLSGQRIAATMSTNRSNLICATSHTVTAKKQ